MDPASRFSLGGDLRPGDDGWEVYKMMRLLGGQRLIIAAALVVGLMTVLAACHKEDPRLRGSVYAGKIPVYPGAKFVGTVGGNSKGAAESKSWFFKTSDPAEEVVSYYKKKLPKAELTSDGAGESTFTLVPEGAEEGEQVQVILHRGGDLQIHESVKAGKKQS